MARIIIATALAGARQTPTEDPLEALIDACVHTSKDMSTDRTDAWIYGIVVGWDDDPVEDQPSGINALDELAEDLGWTTEQRDRLRRLHAAYRAAVQKVAEPRDAVIASISAARDQALADAIRLRAARDDAWREAEIQRLRAEKAERALAALVLPQAFPTGEEADRG